MRRTARFRLPVTAPAVAMAALAAGMLATTTASGDETFVVVKAGRVITVSGEEIPRGEIVIVDGKVRLVGVGLDYPSDATVIDARGETVMPGWVHASTRHGLLGYGRGGVAGDAIVADEMHLDEIDFEPFLAAGYTAAGYRPDGGGIPGVMTVVRTGAPEDLDPLLGESRIVRREANLRITMGNPAGDKQVLRGAIAKARAEIEKIAKARAEWDKKQAEKKAAAEAAPADAAQGGEGGKDGEAPKPETFTPPDTDAAHAPLMAWVQETLAVRPLIELRSASDLLHLEDALAREETLTSHLYLPVGSENRFVVERLAERDAIVLTTMSMTTLQASATLFNFPAELAAAGGQLALTAESIGGGFGGGPRGRGRFGGGGGGATAADAADELGSARSRLVSLVRAGLDREAAIKAVTLHPAMLLGVESRIGSIQAGRDADLVFLSGDPVDPLTEVRRVMVLGRIVWEDTP